jgi:hypothetical protein
MSREKSPKVSAAKNSLTKLPNNNKGQRIKKSRGWNRGKAEESVFNSARRTISRTNNSLIEKPILAA